MHTWPELHGAHLARVVVLTWPVLLSHICSLPGSGKYSCSELRWATWKGSDSSG